MNPANVLPLQTIQNEFMIENILHQDFNAERKENFINAILIKNSIA